MATEATVGLDEPAAGSIDKRLDAVSLTQPTSLLTVLREIITLGDSDTWASLARVLTAAPASGDAGLVVRNIPSGTQTVGGTVTANAGAGVFDVTPTSPAANDYLPVRPTDGTDFLGSLDVDTGAGVLKALAVTWRKGAAGGPEFGTSTDPVRIDPTGVTTQPVSIAAALDVSDRAARLLGQVEGRAAHNVALAGNPGRVGGRAQASQLAPVTDGVTSDLVTDRHGHLHMRDAVQNHAASIFPNVNFPAVNTRASSTRAAGAAGVRHILTGLTAVLAGGATAPAAVQLDVRVRDGILDTGTILWQSVITLPATAGAMNGIARSGLWIPGTAATAMTIEFSAAPGANAFESVSMELVDITE